MLSCLPKVSQCSSLDSGDYDCVVLVTPDLDGVSHPGVKSALSSLADVDKKVISWNCIDLKAEVTMLYFRL